MSPFGRKVAGVRWGYLVRFASLSAVILLACAAQAQVDGTATDAVPALGLPGDPGGYLLYVIPGKPGMSTLYHDGRQVEREWEERWRFMCGSDLTGLTLDDLKRSADNHRLLFETGPTVIVDNPDRAGGLDIVFNIGGSVPGDAILGLGLAETYVESLFSNDITVTISVSFAALGGGTLGSTGSSYVGASYSDSRAGLLAGMDADDVIQDYLPTGSTVPVRYDGNSSTVTDEDWINWTVANYRATIGSYIGLAANMQFNENVNWDWDPTDGIGGNRMSFVDVVIHEVGHALGFVSEADGPGDAMDALDLFRFQRTDGAGDYNPDTYAEFQTTARMVDYNAPGTTDDVVTDWIDNERRMSDGNPYQASHWRETSWIGLMDPAAAYGEDHWPDPFSDNDKGAFDAIGYIYPPCEVPGFTTQPVSQTVCGGVTVYLTVAVDIGFPEYQWRLGTTNLVDGSHIAGATTATLSIIDVDDADEADDYNCLVTNTLDECKAISDNAEITVEDIVFTLQPQNLTVNEGEYAEFSVGSTAGIPTYQWRKDGSPLSNDGRIHGTTTSELWIYPVQVSDAGQYDCVVTSTLGLLCSEVSDEATLTVNGDGCPESGTDPPGVFDYCWTDIYPSPVGDCIVNLSDLGSLLPNYGGTATPYTFHQGDVYPVAAGDGIVNLSDLGQLLAQYGDDCN